MSENPESELLSCCEDVSSYFQDENKESEGGRFLASFFTKCQEENWVDGYLANKLSCWYRIKPRAMLLTAPS